MLSSSPPSLISLSCACNTLSPSPPSLISAASFNLPQLEAYEDVDPPASSSSIRSLQSFRCKLPSPSAASLRFCRPITVVIFQTKLTKLLLQALVSYKRDLSLRHLHLSSPSLACSAVTVSLSLPHLPLSSPSPACLDPPLSSPRCCRPLASFPCMLPAFRTDEASPARQKSSR